MNKTSIGMPQKCVPLVTVIAVIVAVSKFKRVALTWQLKTWSFSVLVLTTGAIR